jgi:Right handed beta helix region
MAPDDTPRHVVPPPSAVLDSVKITSRSGRGLVNIDGGSVTVFNSAVYHCAATGIYVGGAGSQALVEGCDVVANGIGNRARRGVARGHSGVYLEQGRAVIRNCNISSNSLSGISSLHTENAILTLEDSDVTANGTLQLELPPANSLSRERTTIGENVMTTVLSRNFRSNLLTEQQQQQLSPGPHVGPSTMTAQIRRIQNSFERGLDITEHDAVAGVL